MNICEVSKNNMEKIVIALTEFKGHKLLDIRIYYDISPNREADFRPSRKGISTPYDLVRKVKEAVDKALEQIESETGQKTTENQEESAQDSRSAKD